MLQVKMKIQLLIAKNQPSNSTNLYKFQKIGP